MITNEKLKNHVKHLKDKHRELDERIKMMETNHESENEIKALKFEKLRMKKDIAWMESAIQQ